MLSGFALEASDGRACVLSSCRAPGDEEAQVENLITANGNCHGPLPMSLQLHQTGYCS